MKDKKSRSVPVDAYSPWQLGEVPPETEEDAARRAERMRAHALEYPEWHEFSFRRMLKLVTETAKFGLGLILKPLIVLGIVYCVFRLALGEYFFEDDVAPNPIIHFDAADALNESRQIVADIRKQINEWDMKCNCEKCTGQVDISREFLVAFYGSDDMPRPWHSWQIELSDIADECSLVQEVSDSHNGSREVIHEYLRMHAETSAPGRTNERIEVEK